MLFTFYLAFFGCLSIGLPYAAFAAAAAPAPTTPAAARQFMTVEAALVAQAAGTPIPARIIVNLTALEKVSAENINSLFEKQPDRELLINLGKETAIPTEMSEAFKRPNKVSKGAFFGPAITSIGNGFFHRCNNLTSIDFSSLGKVSHLGHSFLSSCSGLTSLDLSPLCNIESIGNDFLSNCQSLQSVDLSSLTKVTRIGNGFLFFCYRLQSVDLSSLKAVTSIGDYFLAKCRSVQSPSLLLPFGKLAKIPDGFLADCSALAAVDLTALTNVTEIGDYFLDGCNNLTDVKTDPNSKLYHLVMAQGPQSKAPISSDSDSATATTS